MAQVKGRWGECLPGDHPLRAHPDHDGGLSRPSLMWGHQTPRLELALRFGVCLFPSMRLQNFRGGLLLLLPQLQTPSPQIPGSPPVSCCPKLGIETRSRVHSLLPFRGVFISVFGWCGSQGLPSPQGLFLKAQFWPKFPRTGHAGWQHTLWSLIHSSCPAQASSVFTPSYRWKARAERGKANLPAGCTAGECGVSTGPPHVWPQRRRPTSWVHCEASWAQASPSGHWGPPTPWPLSRPCRPAQSLPCPSEAPVRSRTKELGPLGRSEPPTLPHPGHTLEAPHPTLTAPGRAASAANRSEPAPQEGMEQAWGPQVKNQELSPS